MSHSVTSQPSIHRGKVLLLLCQENIVLLGRMWKHLRERFQVVKVRVLHPRVSKNSSVAMLRGVPEGSRLSPTLFGIFVADLIHELQEKIPNATITHIGGIRIGEILDVDDLCLFSTDAHELQMMINICQTWSEKARISRSPPPRSVTICRSVPSGQQIVVPSNRSEELV